MTLDDRLDWQVHMVMRESILQDVSETKKINITPEMIATDKSQAKEAILSDLLQIIDSCFESNEGFIDDELRDKFKEYCK